MLVFNGFRLDVTDMSLRRGQRTILLTPKAFNALRYLVEHAGQLVSKDDLWAAAWPGISVTDASLTMCVSEIRKALGDDPKTPRYIETVHRLGYRFIAPVSNQLVRTPESRLRPQAGPVSAGPRTRTPHFVGRESELAQLHEWFEQGLRGERQIVFVTGEPGIGKTTLVEQFLRLQQSANGESLWVGRGQCIDHYGAGEAYLPLLDALGRLCRGPQGGRLVELLDKHAPAWLVQMPGLVGTAEWNALQARVAGGTHERMLRELADAVEVISQERALVLWLEDLHWSDYSTLEWLGFLARRPEPARLLVLGAYRPVEVIVREHRLRGLKQELQIHGHCRELPLSLLSEAAVTEYLALRLANADSSGSDYREGSPQEPLSRLASSIYRRTDGNPLFMVNVVDHLVKQTGDAALVETAGAFELDRLDTPPNLVQMIEHNLAGLNPDEQAVLEAASVTGIEFPAMAVAAGLERPVNDTEAYCTQLARRQQFIEYRGMRELPDGTVTASFGFLHALYRDVLHERVPPGRRAEFHRRIAERVEEAYGPNPGDAAVELAYHYRLSGNRTKTVRYLQLAAERASARRAYHEAERHYRDAIELLGVLPESPERDLRELELRQAATGILFLSKGWLAPELIDARKRITALAEKSDNLGALCASLLHRAWTPLIAGDFATAGALADQALELARREGNPTRLAHAYHLQMVLRYQRGDPAGAEQHFRAGLEFFDDPQFKQKPEGTVATFAFGAYSAWSLGRPDVARQRVAQMMAGMDRNNPAQLVISAFGTAFLHLLLREYEQAETLAAEAVALSQEHQIANYAIAARCVLGSARAQIGNIAEGITLLREGLADMLRLGLRGMCTSYPRYLAEAQGRTGALVDALETIEQTLEINPDELTSRQETLRVRGELRVKQGATEAAETDFRDAIALAQKMGARMSELRASMGLARLLRDTGRRNEAQLMLSEIYNWFNEGFDTPDLKEATALLDELSALVESEG